MLPFNPSLQQLRNLYIWTWKSWIARSWRSLRFTSPYQSGSSTLSQNCRRSRWILPHCGPSKWREFEPIYAVVFNVTDFFSSLEYGWLISLPTSIASHSSSSWTESRLCQTIQRKKLNRRCKNNSERKDLYSSSVHSVGSMPFSRWSYWQVWRCASWCLRE